MSEEKIAETLGLKPLSEVLNNDVQEGEIIDMLPTTTVNAPTMPMVVTQDEVINDIEKAQQNISDLVETGKDALDELISIAKQSQSPRAFEVVSTLVKTLVDANKEVVGMSEKKKFAKDEQPAQQSTTNVTNNNLILSTSDLLRMMKGDPQ